MKSTVNCNTILRWQLKHALWVWQQINPILEQNKSYINYNSNIKLGKPYLIIINRKSKMKKKNMEWSNFFHLSFLSIKNIAYIVIWSNFCITAKLIYTAINIIIIFKDKWRNITWKHGQIVYFNSFGK